MQVWRHVHMYATHTTHTHKIHAHTWIQYTHTQTHTHKTHHKTHTHTHIHTHTCTHNDTNRDTPLVWQFYSHGQLKRNQHQPHAMHASYQHHPQPQP